MVSTDIERACAVTSTRRSQRRTDDVVLGIGRERSQHALDVVTGFESKVLVNLLVHLGSGECHGRCLR
jgi:hypothetical protein